MKVSPQYKRFKHSQLMGDTLSLSDTRSLIIRNLQRLKNQSQNKENDIPKTDKTLSVYDRTFWSFLHLIFEMILILVYYSYERKNHKLTSMNIPGYQCSNVYIDVEKGVLMNKDIQ